MNKFQDLTLLELKSKRNHQAQSAQAYMDKWKEVRMSVDEIEREIDRRLKGMKE